MKLNRCAAVMVMAGLLGVTNAQAIGFVNGSFETGDTTGWSVSDVTGLNPFGTTYGAGMDGAWWAWLAGYELPRYFEQTVSGLSPGSTYSVKFIMASEYLKSDSVVVTANGAGPATFSAPPSSSPTCSYWCTWVEREYVFTATGSSATIRFSTYGLDPAAQYDVGIDNVRINAVPEPATYGLLLAGLGVVAGLARRRASTAGK